jgi:hypothetical protein
MKAGRGTLKWAIEKNSEWPYKVYVPVGLTPQIRKEFGDRKRYLMHWLKQNYGVHYRRYWVMPQAVGWVKDYCVRFKDPQDAVSLKLRCDELIQP